MGNIIELQLHFTSNLKYEKDQVTYNGLEKYLHIHTFVCLMSKFWDGKGVNSLIISSNLKYDEEADALIWGCKTFSFTQLK